MPNWCECRLTVSSRHPDDLAAFMDSVSSSESAFDFNKIIPYPEEYREKDREQEAWYEAHPDDHENAPRDGFNSGGYDWCVANWGTKWNACEVSVFTPTPTKAIILFQTAWDAPYGIMHRLLEYHAKFYHIYPSLRYWEGGQGFQGMLSPKMEWSKDYRGGKGG